MSTNFYWKTLPKEFKGKDSSEESPYIHIGKRSGAGLYCKDCGVTLCTRGTSMVHNSFVKWHDTCPSCGKLVTEGICSFTWTMMKHKQIIEDFLHSEKLDVKNDKLIVDEYDKEYTLSEFMAEIDSPIQQQSFGYWS